MRRSLPLLAVAIAFALSGDARRLRPVRPAAHRYQADGPAIHPGLQREHRADRSRARPPPSTRRGTRPPAPSSSSPTSPSPITIRARRCACSPWLIRATTRRSRSARSAPTRCWPCRSTRTAPGSCATPGSRPLPGPCPGAPARADGRRQDQRHRPARSQRAPQAQQPRRPFRRARPALVRRAGARDRQARPLQHQHRAPQGQPGIESTPLSVNVYDFVLPDERHLQMVGRIEWDSLEALYPDLFETTTPEYMSRNDPKYAQAIKLLDQLVALAHEHRTTVVVPRLQPIVKWPANQRPAGRLDRVRHHRRAVAERRRVRRQHPRRVLASAADRLPRPLPGAPPDCNTGGGRVATSTRRGGWIARGSRSRRRPPGRANACGVHQAVRAGRGNPRGAPVPSRQPAAGRRAAPVHEARTTRT